MFYSRTVETDRHIWIIITNPTTIDKTHGPLVEILMGLRAITLRTDFTSGNKTVSCLSMFGRSLMRKFMHRLNDTQFPLTTHNRHFIDYSDGRCSHKYVITCS